LASFLNRQGRIIEVILADLTRGYCDEDWPHANAPSQS